MKSERLLEIEDTAGQIDDAVRDLQMIVTHHPDMADHGSREAICVRLRSIANLAGSLKRREDRGCAGLDPVTALSTALTDLTDDNELLKIRNMAEIVAGRLDQLLAARQGFIRADQSGAEVADVRKSA
jgi:hypothetical protein